MKKIVLLLAVLLFGAGSMMAQQDKSAEKAAKLSSLFCFWARLPYKLRRNSFYPVLK